MFGGIPYTWPMAWFWIAIVIGFLVPWAVLPRTIRTRFAEDGPRAGLMLWLATSAVTVPITFVIVWLIFRFG